jgi:hypothetical protein
MQQNAPKHKPYVAANQPGKARAANPPGEVLARGRTADPAPTHNPKRKP